MAALHPRPHRPDRSTHGRWIDVDPGRINPGALTARLYRPASIVADAPLVVVLHGCTQTAHGYADAAGWIELADRHGFALLLPEQQRGNNVNLCFNWFEPGDTQRGHGEVASIRAMIGVLLENHDLDPARVFVTGLSAGAAMAGALLATYPEVFAGGGLIAGLPYAIATSMQGALQSMRTGPRETGPALGRHVASASNHAGPWPRVSIWQGGRDRTVAPANGMATLAQWLEVSNVVDGDVVAEAKPHYRRQRWCDAAGTVRIEYVEIAQMGHGTPIDTRTRDAVGYPAPFVLDVGIASSSELLSFWGIATNAAASSGVVDRDPDHHVPALPAARLSRVTPPTSPSPQPTVPFIEQTINDALRAAGLLR